MQKDYTIVVLISGRGSNLGSLIKNRKDYRIAAVISDQPDAAGLNLAMGAAVYSTAFGRSSFTTLKEQKEAIYTAIRDLNPSLIALAGFMQIVAPSFVAEFAGRIVNIHPSLLPDLPGLETHERAILEKRTVHGCTVHLVDAGIDTGQILAQAKVVVDPKDTAETLAAKVLQREHVIYPWVINGLARGDIAIKDGKVTMPDSLREQGKELGFLIP